MHKDLYRQFIWHLRYVESLLDATLDVDVAEENLKALAFHTSQLEKVLADALPQGGGGSASVLFAEKNSIRICLLEKFHTKMPCVLIVTRMNVIERCG